MELLKGIVQLSSIPHSLLVGIRSEIIEVINIIDAISHFPSNAKIAIVAAIAPPIVPAHVLELLDYYEANYFLKNIPVRLAKGSAKVKIKILSLEISASNIKMTRKQPSIK